MHRLSNFSSAPLGTPNLINEQPTPHCTGAGDRLVPFPALLLLRSRGNFVREYRTPACCKIFAETSGPNQFLRALPVIYGFVLQVAENSANVFTTSGAVFSLAYERQRSRTDSLPSHKAVSIA